MSRNIFSDESLADWLDKQPPDAGYDFIDSSKCVMTQYFRAMGRVCQSTYFERADDEPGPYVLVPKRWHYVALGGLRDKPDDVTSDVRPTWTYGDALRRLREVMAEEAV